MVWPNTNLDECKRGQKEQPLHTHLLSQKTTHPSPPTELQERSLPELKLVAVSRLFLADPILAHTHLRLRTKATSVTGNYQGWSNLG